MFKDKRHTMPSSNSERQFILTPYLSSPWKQTLLWATYPQISGDMRTEVQREFLDFPGVELCGRSWAGDCRERLSTQQHQCQNPQKFSGILIVGKITNHTVWIQMIETQAKHMCLLSQDSMKLYFQMKPSTLFISSNLSLHLCLYCDMPVALIRLICCNTAPEPRCFTNNRTLLFAILQYEKSKFKVPALGGW